MELDYNEPAFTIGVVAQKLGISVPTVRMYEKAGLIIPFRTATERRLYSLADLERLRFFRKLIKEEGLNLESIRRLLAILPCWGLKPCTADMRENCPANNNCKAICWMLPSTACQKDDISCRNCPVYLESYKDIENIKQFLMKSKF
jgi:MerR family transcriptional regulator/heat shock protein HspR